MIDSIYNLQYILLIVFSVAMIDSIWYLLPRLMWEDMMIMIQRQKAKYRQIKPTLLLRQMTGHIEQPSVQQQQRQPQNSHLKENWTKEI